MLHVRLHMYHICIDNGSAAVLRTSTAGWPDSRAMSGGGADDPGRRSKGKEVLSELFIIQLLLVHALLLQHPRQSRLLSHVSLLTSTHSHEHLPPHIPHPQ